MVSYEGQLLSSVQVLEGEGVGSASEKCTLKGLFFKIKTPFILLLIGENKGKS